MEEPASWFVLQLARTSAMSNHMTEPEKGARTKSALRGFIGAALVLCAAIIIAAGGSAEAIAITALTWRT